MRLHWSVRALEVAAAVWSCVFLVCLITGWHVEEALVIWFLVIQAEIINRRARE